MVAGDKPDDGVPQPRCQQEPGLLLDRFSIGGYWHRLDINVEMYLLVPLRTVAMRLCVCYNRSRTSEEIGHQNVVICAVINN